MRRCVIDASITVAWCFEDEKTPLSERVLNSLASGAQAVVPSLWPYEVLNALLAAQRRKRVSEAQCLLLWNDVLALAISVDAARDGRSLSGLLALAELHRLTVYDAAYLELAMRENLPLATLDADLRKAAEAVGLELSR